MNEQLKALADLIESDRRNPWMLYDSHPQFIVATANIEAAWQQAIRLAPELPSSERAALAEQHVAKALHKWRAAGADDTEPRWVLMDRLRRQFSWDGH